MSRSEIKELTNCLFNVIFSVLGLMLPVRFTLSPRWGSMVECHCLMFDESSTMKFARAYSWQTRQVDMGQFLSNLLLLKTQSSTGSSGQGTGAT
jgi:hypothetical protein